MCRSPRHQVGTYVARTDDHDFYLPKTSSLRHIILSHRVWRKLKNAELASSER